jgi:hypothetical protein
MFAPFDMLGHHAPGTYCIGTGVQLHNFIIGEVSIPNSQKRKMLKFWNKTTKIHRNYGRAMISFAASKILTS